MLRELSKVEQRYDAVLAVIRAGMRVTEVAEKFGVHRDTVHSWLARYEAGGLEGLQDRSHRPKTSPLQMPAVIEGQGARAAAEPAPLGPDEPAPPTVARRRVTASFRLWDLSGAAASRPDRAQG